MEKTYDIAQAARFIGVPASTLRYWEDEGLIHAQRDEGNGYRRYTLHDLMEAGEVAFYREMGISVKTLAGYRSFSVEQFDDVLADARRGVEKRMRELEFVKGRVDRQLELNARARRLAAGESVDERPSFQRLDELDYDSAAQWDLLIAEPERYGVYVSAEGAHELVEAVIDPDDPAPCALLWPRSNDDAELEWEECLLKCDFNGGRSNAAELFAATRDEGRVPRCIVGRYLLTASEGERWDWYQAWVGCIR